MPIIIKSMQPYLLAKSAILPAVTVRQPVQYGTALISED